LHTYNVKIFGKEFQGLGCYALVCTQNLNFVHQIPRIFTVKLHENHISYHYLTD